MNKGIDCCNILISNMFDVAYHNTNIAANGITVGIKEMTHDWSINGVIHSLWHQPDEIFMFGQDIFVTHLRDLL